MIDKNTAIQYLQKSIPVALPTETVYGLAAPINDELALQKIFEIKERPLFDPLIVHVNSLKMAQECVEQWPQIAQVLAKHFWPGPLTLVLPKKASVISDLITAGGDTVALRSPNHLDFLDIITQLQTPLAAPSANRFGKTSPTCGQHVQEEFGENFPILAGENCKVGIESTVCLIESETISILRPGIISLSMISAVLTDQQCPFKLNKNAEPTNAPGQLKDHYQPDVPLYIASFQQLQEYKKLGYAELLLKPTPTESARILYSELRRLASKYPGIYFDPQKLHPQHDWSAILDRLNKAAINA